MRTRWLLVVAAALAAFGAPTVARAQSDTKAPDGSVGIRIVDAPTDRAEDPRARLYIVDHLAPGSTISRRVEVSNGTGDALKVPVYAAAASVRSGTFRFADGRAVNELTTWTTVDPQEVALAPKGTAIATVKIVVPADASPGERYAVVWAELPANNPAGGGISTVNRVGIRIYLSVGPGGEPASDFEITKLQPRRGADGAPVLAAVVKNTGGRALDLNGELRLTDGPGGLSAGPFNAELGNTLAVGATEPVLVKLDKAIPAGPWKARITLKSGLVERTASAVVTFPDRGAGKPVSTTTSSGSKLGVLVGGGVVLFLILIVGWRLLNRRSRRRGDGPSDA